MSVQQRPTTSHVFEAHALERQAPGIYRAIGAGLWIFSFTGNVLAFGGPLAIDRATMQAIIIALVWQALCTWVQFVFCRQWNSIIYVLALLASAVPSLLGYRKWIALPIAEWIGVTIDPFADRIALSMATPDTIALTLAVHVGVLIILVAADIIPERIYVRR
jgi:hypothetical protein